MNLTHMKEHIDVYSKKHAIAWNQTTQPPEDFSYDEIEANKDHFNPHMLVLTSAATIIHMIVAAYQDLSIPFDQSSIQDLTRNQLICELYNTMAVVRDNNHNLQTADVSESETNDTPQSSPPDKSIDFDLHQSTTSQIKRSNKANLTQYLQTYHQKHHLTDTVWTTLKVQHLRDWLTQISAQSHLHSDPTITANTTDDDINSLDPIFVYKELYLRLITNNNMAFNSKLSSKKYQINTRAYYTSSQLTCPGHPSYQPQWCISTSSYW